MKVFLSLLHPISNVRKPSFFWRKNQKDLNNLKKNYILISLLLTYPHFSIILFFLLSIEFFLSLIPESIFRLHLIFSSLSLSLLLILLILFLFLFSYYSILSISFLFIQLILSFLLILFDFSPIYLSSPPPFSSLVLQLYIPHTNSEYFIPMLTFHLHQEKLY